MTKVQILEREIKKLDRDDLTAFRDWFRRYDSSSWDRQMERNARAGKLDKFAAQALAEHKTGKADAL